MDPIAIEELAAQEHGQWQGWTAWMLDKIEEEIGSSRVRPDLKEQILFVLSELQCVKRWRRQIQQPYAELTEREKESDRKEVRLKLPVYRKAIVEARANE